MTCLGYNEVFHNNLLSIFSGKTAITILLFLQCNLKERGCLQHFLQFLSIRNAFKELLDFLKCFPYFHTKTPQTDPNHSVTDFLKHHDIICF